MKFKVTNSSDMGAYPPEEVEINSLDELKEFQEKQAFKDSSWFERPSLIIDFNNQTIEIYDDYRE